MTHVSAEAALLRDALEIDSAEEFSREPLGNGTVAGFHVQDGDRTVALYVDTSGIAVEAETGLAQDGVGRIWTHPADPHLPALATAAFGSAAQTLLARLGIDGVEAPEMVAYRPGRRAVLTVMTGEGPLWIKIVRPRHVERIVAAHRALRDSGVAVPKVRAWSPTGLLVIDQAEGTPATHADWTPAGLVDAVERVRVAIGATPTDQRTRSAALTRVDWYADRLASLDAVFGERASALRAVLATTPASRETTVHGDLHFGQLFMNADASEITGLIDVDTLGRGDAAEDPAAFVSHAVASWALAVDSAPSAVRRLADLVATAGERWGSDPAVAGRTAAQLLGHTTSALESGHRERAERLLVEAEAWTSRVGI
ncbi:phosphotransferase family protein [Microbacterium sp. NC79]|uniref:phosphotransferase family protein n=1 Tax=Microbacterium sp. NC79 TaxID=2851009 RepID=UPI001C2B8CD8|nr:phosphotransferase [Microbacterium sp. NC79]MBV0893659.1 aminoglycoside phosphotransferase family protein [Microbacterium sp. NC79]